MLFLHIGPIRPAYDIPKTPSIVFDLPVGPFVEMPNRPHRPNMPYRPHRINRTNMG